MVDFFKKLEGMEQESNAKIEEKKSANMETLMVHSLCKR